jgi:hypothetical protein
MDNNDLATKTAAETEPVQGITAWEEIASGRFMPRRIRGSCRGRVLG